jgi:regulator of CtrA degradation
LSEKTGRGEFGGRDAGNTIAFGRRYAESAQFQIVYSEGMALIEDTARYLDGDGRRRSGDLDQSTGLLYSTESMRLTTRLMQLASWLLIRRAVTEGEMAPEEAYEKKNKIKLMPAQIPAKSAAWDGLPDRLKELIETSHRLHARVLKLDAMLSVELAGVEAGPDNPQRTNLQRLLAAYGGPEADGELESK